MRFEKIGVVWLAVGFYALVLVWYGMILLLVWLQK